MKSNAFVNGYLEGYLTKQAAEEAKAAKPAEVKAAAHTVTPAKAKQDNKEDDKKTV